MSKIVEGEQKLEIPKEETHRCVSFLQRKRSDGGSTSDIRRLRRQSISFTPETGDDIIARTVQSMNEELKQIHLLKREDPESSSLNDEKTNDPATYGGPSVFQWKEDLVSTWNKVLQSFVSLTQPLSPLEEWNIDFSELHLGARVGIGFFGEVFRGIWNGTDVAVKVLHEQNLTPENMDNLCNEISILSRLRHPNVVLFLGACITPPHLSVVTEYMDVGSLYHFLHKSGPKNDLSWRRRLKMLRDICRGLTCIHRMKIVHRDLKSTNCLVNKHWGVKICDFGLSRAMRDGPITDKSAAGTPGWMAPELLMNHPYTEKCDIFSLGVIMWELSTLQKPWEGDHPFQVIHSVVIAGKRLPIPDGPLGELIADCWAEPNERPTCSQIMTRLNVCEFNLRSSSTV